MYEVRAEKGVWGLGERAFRGFCVEGVSCGRIHVKAGGMFSEFEEWVLRELCVDKCLAMEMELRKEEEDEVVSMSVPVGTRVLDPPLLEAESAYSVRARVKCLGEASGWSECAEFRTPVFAECCAWRRCPALAREGKKYSVSRRNPRVATKIGERNCLSVVLGNTPIPRSGGDGDGDGGGRVVEWGVKIVKTMDGDCAGIYVGVAPYDVDVNKDDAVRGGWYLHCHDSTLWSGPPQRSNGERGGMPFGGGGAHMCAGDVLYVSMDTRSGELSFSVNGGRRVCGFSKVPFYKPLFQSVVISIENDSVEFVEGYSNGDGGNGSISSGYSCVIS